MPRPARCEELGYSSRRPHGVRQSGAPHRTNKHQDAWRQARRPSKKAIFCLFGNYRQQLIEVSKPPFHFSPPAIPALSPPKMGIMLAIIIRDVLGSSAKPHATRLDEPVPRAINLSQKQNVLGHRLMVAQPGVSHSQFEHGKEPKPPKRRSS